MMEVTHFSYQNHQILSLSDISFPVIHLGDALLICHPRGHKASKISTKMTRLGSAIFFMNKEEKATLKPSNVEPL